MAMNVEQYIEIIKQNQNVTVDVTSRARIRSEDTNKRLQAEETTMVVQ